MPPNETTLLRLAEAVADGSRVDWEHAESSAAGPEERHAIQQLRLLATVVHVTRDGAAAWGPLQIRGVVGGGTFGAVYRAWDPRLEREVALKLLHGTGRQASTVVKEARLLARIRHPNVVTVYGADVIDGKVGIWMEFVSGRTLKDIVQERGPFGAYEAALIGRDLCRALAAVHHQGFLHRDVKAQNVMREAGGRTVLMDFGAGESVTPPATSAPALRGTPLYLGPELLNGEPPSVRTDLYSLGVLLYFLVSGEFPVMGSSLDELRQRHAAGTRRPLRDVRPDLPSAFIRAVDSAIAASPSERPESAGAMERLLENTLLSPGDTHGRHGTWWTALTSSTRRTIALSIAVLLATLAGWGAWQATRRSTPAVQSRDSVAILPFRNLTGSRDDDYLSEGITADLIANLAALPDLRVIAGSSVFHYKDRVKRPVDIGAELGVATVLDASVRKAGDHLRIVAQLIDTRTGEQIWLGSFDSRPSDIAAMKSDVSYKIAVALRGELSQRDIELLRRGKRYDAEAFNIYLRGRHDLGLRTEAALNRAIQSFHDALGRSPDFAPAYAGLAEAYNHLGVYGAIPRQEAFARSAAAAEKAVALDDTLAEAHATLAYARKNRFDWKGAESSFTRAIELRPGYAAAHHWYSIFLTQHGRFTEAITEIKIALSRDPLSIGPNLQLASLLLMARRYDDAIAQYERTQQMDAGFAPIRRYVAIAHAHQRLFDRAYAELDRARQLTAPGADDQELKADIAYVHAATGRTSEALVTARQLAERYQRNGEHVAGSIAAIYAGLRQNDTAFRWLSRAHSDRDPEMGFLKVDPKWDNLRDDPRFNQLLRTLGFSTKTGGRNGGQ